jgi:hypothetical protein
MRDCGITSAMSCSASPIRRTPNFSACGSTGERFDPKDRGRGSNWHRWRGPK